MPVNLILAYCYSFVSDCVMITLNVLGIIYKMEFFIKALVNKFVIEKTV